MANLDWHAARSDLSGVALLDRAPESEGIDLRAVRLYRRERVRGEMAKRGIDAVILSDPVNIRYATGTRNMQVFSQRNAPARYLLLTASRSILFEFTGCLHLAAGFETVGANFEWGRVVFTRAALSPGPTMTYIAPKPTMAEITVTMTYRPSDVLRCVLK